MDGAMDNPEAEHEDREHEIIKRAVVREIDETEQMAARHALQPVFAAGELRLKAEKVHHLREGQRNHREINALAPDRETADDIAERRRRRGPDKQAQLG